MVDEVLPPSAELDGGLLKKKPWHPEILEDHSGRYNTLQKAAPDKHARSNRLLVFDAPRGSTVPFKLRKAVLSKAVESDQQMQTCGGPCAHPAV
jgi:hypothetical protein